MDYVVTPDADGKVHCPPIGVGDTCTMQWGDEGALAFLLDVDWSFLALLVLALVLGFVVGFLVEAWKERRK